MRSSRKLHKYDNNNVYDDDGSWPAVPRKTDSDRMIKKELQLYEMKVSDNKIYYVTNYS